VAGSTAFARSLRRRATHWHADPAIRIEYVATDKERQTIPYVKVTNAQGRVKEYAIEGASRQQLAQGEHRVCIKPRAPSATA
jgi:hypothetical protein